MMVTRASSTIVCASVPVKLVEMSDVKLRLVPAVFVILLYCGLNVDPMWRYVPLVGRREVDVLLALLVLDDSGCRRPVRRMFFVAFLDVTSVWLIRFGTTPAITGRSGSPPSNVSSTSVPLRSGKWNDSGLPPWGCIIRIRVEFLPSFPGLSSKWICTR